MDVDVHAFVDRDALTSGAHEGAVEPEVAVHDRDVLRCLDAGAEAFGGNVDEVAPDVIDGHVVQDDAVGAAGDDDAVLELIAGVVAGLVHPAFDAEVLDREVHVSVDAEVIPVPRPVLDGSPVRRGEPAVPESLVADACAVATVGE